MLYRNGPNIGPKKAPTNMEFFPKKLLLKRVSITYGNLWASKNHVNLTAKKFKIFQNKLRVNLLMNFK